VGVIVGPKPVRDLEGERGVRNGQRLFGDNWADQAQRMVAQFRATHDLWSGDPAFVELVDRLRRGCPEFQGWWRLTISAAAPPV
jgi:hypothetical protein